MDYGGGGEDMLPPLPPKLLGSSSYDYELPTNFVFWWSDLVLMIL